MSEQSLSQRAYFVVYAALVALTLATVGISFVDLGRWHTAVGLCIAAAKATLVALIFMHVWLSDRLYWAVLAAGLFWIGILLSFTLADYLARPWLAY